MCPHQFSVIFCKPLSPPPRDPGLSQVNNNQSMFRIRFRIFSVPYRAEMSIRNPTPPGTQPHTITLNPKPSARNLSNPSFSSNLSNLCHCATSYPDPPSKLGSSIFSNETSTNKRIEVGLWSVLWRAGLGDEL